MEVEVVCSWCDSSLGWKEFEFSNPKEIHRPITHGICSKCLNKEMARISTMPINPINKTQQMKGDQDD